MSIAQATPTVPTRAHFDRAARKLSDAQAAVERVAFDLAEAADRAENGNPKVTAADIGELWSFTDAVRLDIGSLRQSLETMHGALGRLDSARLDAGARGEGDQS